MIEKNDKVKIQDNFLPKEEFVILRDTLLGQPFPWYFNTIIVDADDDRETSPGFLVHQIYNTNIPRSPYFNSHFIPLLEALDVDVLLRIQINLNWRLPKPFFCRFHVDRQRLMGEDFIAQWFTSIFYINTNNGYTELETGEKIESVANRLVTYPLNIMHRGVTQTDTQQRVLINFNYLSDVEERESLYENM